MTLRKNLCADSLIPKIRSSLSKVIDVRKRISHASLVDVFMSGFALFSLKSPSLLAFDNDRKDSDFQKNMKNLYGIENIPSDTRLREILDEVNLESLRPAFISIFNQFQKDKGLEKFKFINNKFLIALDGTGYFSSENVHCAHCMEKTSKSGKVSYYHQMVGSVLIHPDEKVVIPLCPEPIVKQDGSTKNDCERNAVSRWLESFRKEHPKLQVIITEDGLSSNGPHIEALIKHNCSFILGTKPGDHKYLFELFHLSGSEVKQLEIKRGNTTHIFKYMNQLPINEANSHLLVNLLHYTEITDKKTTTFSWVTDIEINDENVFELMKGGRARWKIENETFNTLKNQGYNFEHNYGHGKNNLSVVLAQLMFLAFAVDQIQLASCKLFQEAFEVVKKLSKLWATIRSWFELSCIPNWTELFKVIALKQKMIFPNTA